MDDLSKAAPPIAVPRPHAVPSPHGTRRDEYYWLRDDARASPAVLEHLRRENAWRDTVLAPAHGLQERLFAELTGRLQPDEASVPVLYRGYWYYVRFEPGHEYPVHARRKGSLDAAEEILLDGNAMAATHEYFQIGSTAVSPDGRFLAWSEDSVGRRQYTLRIKDLARDRVLEDRIENVEPDIVWAADNATLLYIEKDPVTLLSVRARRHTLGRPAAEDPLVYEEPDHSYYMGLGKSRSERYLFIELRSTEQSEWRYADAADPKLEFRTVLPRAADHEYAVEHLGSDFIIRSNRDAPNFRIVRVPVAHCADTLRWREVLAHRSDAFIQDFEVTSSHLVLNERSGGLLRMRLRSWDGADDRLLDGGEAAFCMELVPTPDPESRTVRYVYSSLTTPDTTWDYELDTHTKQLRKVQKVLGGFEAANYATELCFVPARDGESVPVSIAWRRGTPRDGSAPLYQYGYGAYGLSNDPHFRQSWISLLDRGFVVAIAHVRGGQELGRRWYDAGRLLNKRNSFTDFIDCTRYLVQQRYAAADKVFASGGSAGGLLMGAVANMAPQEYRGIIAHVPFVDVVTTMLDESIPLTTNEYDEWGDPRERRYYDYMLSYSPYDNVGWHAYPAMLVLTGLWDSQVQYWEPAKWVARLRARRTDERPLVFSIDMSAGHGGKSGRFQRFRDTALEYAFILQELGITV